MDMSPISILDAANPEVWQALKREFGENYNDQWIKRPDSRVS